MLTLTAIKPATPLELCGELRDLIARAHAVRPDWRAASAEDQWSDGLGDLVEGLTRMCGAVAAEDALLGVLDAIDAGDVVMLPDGPRCLPYPRYAAA